MSSSSSVTPLIDLIRFVVSRITSFAQVRETDVSVFFLWFVFGE